MSAEAIRGGKKYSTENSDMIFDAPFKMGGVFPYVGKVWVTANKNPFMTAHPEDHAESERFMSYKIDDIIEFLDEVEASPDVYEKLNIKLEEA